MTRLSCRLDRRCFWRWPTLLATLLTVQLLFSLHLDRLQTPLATLRRSLRRFLSPSEQSNLCSLLNLDVPFLFGTSKIANESPTAAVVTFLPFTITTVAVHPECISFLKNFSSRLQTPASTPTGEGTQIRPPGSARARESVCVSECVKE